MTKMKKLMISLGIAAILLTGLIVSIPFVNDYSARCVEKQLLEIPLPENTAVVESLSKASKLVGNGNGMQYFGAILVQSDLSLDELLIHYQTALPGAVVKQQTTQQIECIEHGSVSFDTAINGGDYYIVYYFGSGIKPFSELDVRGH